MGFHLRAEWADLHPNFSPALRPAGTAVVHHTVGAWHPGQDKVQWLRGLEHSVTDNVAPGNSSPLSAIDYNELIFPDGDVWEGRGLNNEDAATYRFNGQSVSWALVGNYDVNQVPDAMVRALADRIVAAMKAGYLISAPRVIGHRDVGTFATACPGRFTEERLPEVRALVIAGGSGSLDDMSAEDVTAVNAHTDQKLLELAGAIFTKTDAIAEDVQNVRQAVRDKDGVSIPAKIWRKITGTTPGP
jgi:hypothetical protein